jgi:hypothetical protein
MPWLGATMTATTATTTTTTTIAVNTTLLLLLPPPPPPALLLPPLSYITSTFSHTPTPANPARPSAYPSPGPSLATLPALCWFKPSRTPAAPTPAPRLRVETRPKLYALFFIRRFCVCRASSTMPQCVKVPPCIALPLAHLSPALVPIHLPPRSRSSQRSD